MARGITDFGAYVPYLRLQRAAVVAAHAWFHPGLKAHAKGERAVANWDEDSVTMAVEAARDCLAGRDRGRVGQVVLASTSLPFADRQNSVLVKEALNLPTTVGALDVAASQRAGTSALKMACDAARGTTLCIGAEKRRAKPGSEAELVNGDGAAAFVVGDGDVIAEYLGGYSTSVDVVDHYRAADRDHDYTWESRWIRETVYGDLLPAAIAEALGELRIAADEVDHLVVAAPFRNAAAGIAKKTGIRAEALADDLAAEMGISGAAHPLVMLADVLERARPGACIVVAGFGQGCDVLAFRVTGAIAGRRPRLGLRGWLARRKTLDNYTRFLALTGEIRLERGIRAEADQQTALSVLYRNRKPVLGLVGGRCTVTGTVQFPKTPISVAQNRHSVDTQEDYPLADRAARIMTYTADRLAYTPDPPLCFGTVLFEGGGRITVDFADTEPEALEVGLPMRMMFRIRAVDENRGFTRYFWKAVPGDATAKSQEAD